MGFVTPRCLRLTKYIGTIVQGPERSPGICILGRHSGLRTLSNAFRARAGAIVNMSWGRHHPNLYIRVIEQWQQCAALITPSCVFQLTSGLSCISAGKTVIFLSVGNISGIVLS